MRFRIEKNIPLPLKYSNGSHLYPFALMKVGESFRFPNKMKKKIANSVIYHAKKTRTKFCIRDNRIWRIK